MALSWNSGSNFFVLNPFREILESVHIQQIVRYSMLTEGTNLDLCGKINVRNCNLSQRDFFARSRTVLGVAKVFFGMCSKTWKKLRLRYVVTLFP